MLSKIHHKAIDHLIDENYIYAKVLHYFGVEFYNNRGKTFQEVCQEYNVDQSKFVSILEDIDKDSTPNLDFKQYPSSLIIEYLKHAHQVFIKDKLPYLLKLINDLKGEGSLIKDLKFIFPLFVEDFIKHVYEEEDRFFSYVETLNKCVQGQVNLARVYSRLNNFSIQEFALHHSDSDDEMRGIRGITDHYKTKDIRDLHLKVIFRELETFDKELGLHARIENDILFPKALSLEKRVQSLVQYHVRSN